MKRESANKILQMLKAYYPKYYGSSIPPEQAKMMVDDFCETFAKFDDDVVIDAYKRWHLESNVPPAISTMLSMLRSEKREKVEGSEWVYFTEEHPYYKGSPDPTVEYAYKVKKGDTQ